MGTEDYWKDEKKRIDINKSNVNPIIRRTYEDKKALQGPKHFKELYTQCLQGALYLKQWALSDNLTEDEMAMLICKDVGCELNYCQLSMSDPYERPFENCDQQYRNLNRCIAQEITRFEENSEGRTMQEQVLYMLEKKKREKYFDFFEELRKHNIENIEKQTIQTTDRELTMKNNNL
jgi:hypothetical protein